jgi:hypothetical protein
MPRTGRSTASSGSQQRDEFEMNTRGLPTDAGGLMAPRAISIGFAGAAMADFRARTFPPDRCEAATAYIGPYQGHAV